MKLGLPTAQISGYVMRQSPVRFNPGTVLGAVKIIVAGNGEKFTDQSNQYGAFNFTGLKSGEFLVTAENPNNAKERQTQKVNLQKGGCANIFFEFLPQKTLPKPRNKSK